MTARRREESLQDVPVAITALSTADLENKMLRQVDDLKNFVPGLHVQGLKRDDSTIYIRGQGPGSQVTGQRNFSSIATYFAEVPTTIAGPGVFFDLTNVQVLKGPQGTLFGRNTTGGAVLFEPAAPTWDNEGYAQVQFGNYSMKQFNGVLNVAPVPDKVAIRSPGSGSRLSSMANRACTACRSSTTSDQICGPVTSSGTA